MAHLSLFEHLASTDQENRDTSRKAAVAAHKRVKDSFGSFLSAATDEAEYQARFDLIEDDFKATVASAVEDYGGDPARVEATLRRELTFRKEAPGNQHLPGASDKRNRQYEHIKSSCLEDGKSEEECKELAARTVNKQRAEHGETKSSKTAVGLGGPGRLSPMHPGNAVQGEVPNTEQYDTCPNCQGQGCSNCGGTGRITEADYLDRGVFQDVPSLDTAGMPGFRSHTAAGLPEEGQVGGVASEFGENPQTINLEPNWENMRRWVLNMAQTDPEAARNIAEAMGSEAPEELLSGTYGDDLGPFPSEQQPGIRGPEPQSFGQASVRTARRPKMCPYHSEVTDISLTAGDPLAGYQAMSSHAWGPQHCQGEGYEGRCNFKREMVTQDFWDKRAEQAEERRQERQRQQEIDQQVQETPVPENLEGIDETPPAEEPSFTDDGSSAIGEGVEAEPVQTEDMSPVAARTSEALETIDVQKGKAGTPSPVMDKDKWNPQEGRGEPIPTEGEGSPHPTKRVDPLVPIVPQNNEQDFLEGTKAVTEKQDVEKEISPQKGGEGGTWTGNNGASPVSSVQSDVQKNPIREILQSGFVPQNAVDQAIQSYEQ